MYLGRLQVSRIITASSDSIIGFCGKSNLPESDDRILRQFRIPRAIIDSVPISACLQRAPTPICRSKGGYF